MNINDIIQLNHEVEKVEIKVGDRSVIIPKRLSMYDIYAIVRIAVESNFEVNTGKYDSLIALVQLKVMAIDKFLGLKIPEDYFGGTLLFDVYDAFEKLHLFEKTEKLCADTWEDINSLKEALEASLYKQQISFAFLGKALNLQDLGLSDEALKDIQSDDFLETIEKMEKITGVVT